MSNLIVFDLDGVITSEEAYWDAAGLTLHELLYSPRYWNIDRQQLGVDGCYHPAISAEESRRSSRMLFPEAEIQALKARSINSNWDTCYATACLHLIDLLALLPALEPLLPLRPWDSDWLADFRMHRVSLPPVPNPRIPARGITCHYLSPGQGADRVPTMDEGARGAVSRPW